MRLTVALVALAMLAAPAWATQELGVIYLQCKEDAPNSAAVPYEINRNAKTVRILVKGLDSTFELLERDFEIGFEEKAEGHAELSLWINKVTLKYRAANSLNEAFGKSRFSSGSCVKLERQL